MHNRHKKAPEKENNERWLLTYSDLITLLMIFFVIMYAMSSVNAQKFMTLTQSLNAALDPNNKIPIQSLASSGLTTAANPTTGDHSTGYSPTPTPKITKTEQKQIQALMNENIRFNNLYKRLQNYVNQNGLSNSVSLYNQTRGIQITLRDVVLFQTGQDTLLSGAQQILLGLVPFLQSVTNPIVVEGYTDNVPIDTSQFPSNWELSTGRAVNVVHFLITNHLLPSRLSAEGFGQYHPVAPNTSSINRQMNRRVNIVILRKSIADIIDQTSGNSSSTSTTGKTTTTSSKSNVTLPGFKNIIGVNPATDISSNYSQTPENSLQKLPQHIFGPTPSKNNTN